MRRLGPDGGHGDIDADRCPQRRGRLARGRLDRARQPRGALGRTVLGERGELAPARRSLQQRALTHRDATEPVPHRDRERAQRRQQVSQPVGHYSSGIHAADPPINLTTVPPRPLHAVLLPEIPLALLAAALDGSGPALLPLDPGLPPARLAELLGAVAPSAIVTQDGVESLPAGDRQGLAEDVAVVLGTSGSTGVPKGAEITASALLASAWAALGRVGGD